MLKVEIKCDYCGKNIDLEKEWEFIVIKIFSTKSRLVNQNEIETTPHLDIGVKSPIILVEKIQKELHICGVCFSKLESYLKK